MDSKRITLTRRSFLMVPCALAAGAPPASQGENYPVQLGVDDSTLFRASTPAEVSRLFEILEQLGLKHVDIHLNPITDAGARNASLMAQRIAQIDLARQRLHEVSDETIEP
jgi:hypothetical protein